MDPVVSILTQVYGQPKMLEEFLLALREWPLQESLKTEVVIVDDCGSPPVDPDKVRRMGGMGIQLLRHTKDIPWAQPSCRNLAAKYAKGEVLILLDPDMVIPAVRAQHFFDSATSLKPGHVTRFVLNEINHPNKDLRGKVNLTSPNAWIIRKADFLAIGGYNEEFSGNKGWSDVELMHVLDSAYKVRQDKTLKVDFYRRSGLLTDADVRGLDREVKTNHQIHAMHRETVRKKFQGNWQAWVKAIPRKKLNLPYERLI